MQGRSLYCGEPRGQPLAETTLPQGLKDLGYTTRLVDKGISAVFARNIRQQGTDLIVTSATGMDTLITPIT